VSTSVSVEELKIQLSQSLSQVASGDGRLIVLDGGKPIVALVSMDDLRRLEASDPPERDIDATTHPIMSVFGAWADYEGLDELVAEIYADRQRKV